MAKPILPVVVGDTHHGSRYAIGHAEQLRGHWATMVDEVKHRARGHDLLVMIGGDVVEGQQHRTHQSIGNAKDQRDLAVDFLQPLVNLATYAYGITGTEAHANDAGSDDAQVYETLGVEWAEGGATLEIGGWTIDWAHHGVGVPPVLRNEANGLIERIKKTVERANAEGRTVPSHVIRHHAHRSPKPVFFEGVWGAVCPCWQLSTGYAKKVADGILPSIGYLVINPKSSAIERRLFDVQFSRKVFKVGK